MEDMLACPTLCSLHRVLQKNPEKLGGEGEIYFTSNWFHSPRDGQRDDTAQGS